MNCHTLKFKNLGLLDSPLETCDICANEVTAIVHYMYS